MENKTILVLMMVFYFLVGVNHFINADFYVMIIPPYLPFPKLLNYLAGFCEIALAILIFWPKTRTLACWVIILMLLAFLPVHIYMINLAKNGTYKLGNLTISPLLAWGRIPIQMLFIAWAYWCSKMKFKLFKS